MHENTNTPAFYVFDLWKMKCVIINIILEWYDGMIELNLCKFFHLQNCRIDLAAKVIWF